MNVRWPKAGTAKDTLASMPSVLLVDDDPRIRTAVRAMLTADSGGRYSLVGEAGTCLGALALARKLKPDVLLLDLGLPDGKGTSVMCTLRNEGTAPLALVLTVFDDDEHIFDALRAGAVGYLLKDDIGVRLIASLDEVCSGGSPMSPSIARRILTSFVPPATKSGDLATSLLTPREREVTELLAQGATYDEIGITLKIATNTVRTFIRSIYEKLQVSSKTEAVREAMRLGIVDKP